MTLAGRSHNWRHHPIGHRSGDGAGERSTHVHAAHMTSTTVLSPEPKPSVAVIGTGLMGSAIARTLARAGHRVTAWNRTAARAEALTDEGIVAVATVAEAVAEAELVIACTSTAATTRETFADVTDWEDRVLVNVTTGTPDDAVEMEAWAAERAIGYLDGAIICFPEYVGAPDALFVYAGPAPLWQRHETTLLRLGGASRHVSEQIGAASVLDTAIIGSFYVSAVGAYVEAATYAHANGVPAPMLREATKLVLKTLGHSTKAAAREIESGEHATEQATLATYARGSRNTLASTRGSGHSMRLLAAAVEYLDAAEAAGLGHLGLYAQTRVMGTD